MIKIQRIRCDYCGEFFKEIKSKIERTKNNFCCKECYFEYKRDKGRETKIKYTCDYCGKEIFQSKKRIKEHENHFCSKECHNKFKKTGKYVKCDECGKELYRCKAEIKRTETFFCSRKCLNKNDRFRKEIGAKAYRTSAKQDSLTDLELKGRKILKELGYKEGVDFKEQVPIDIYTVDVLFPKKNIIIEWDGNFWHNQPERVKHDKERDKFLSQLGFNIIHITSEEIKDTEDTKNKINEELSL